MSKQITIKGKTYEEEPESYECDGCIAKGCVDLCGQLPECKDIIFIEKEAMK